MGFFIWWGGEIFYTFIHLFSKGEGTHVEVRECLVGVTSLHRVDPGYRTQVFRLGGSCFNLLSHLAFPDSLFYKE